MTDDVDVIWDFTSVPSRFDDGLHAPYVRGAKIEVFTHSSDEDADFRGWSIETSDPAVFRIDGSPDPGERTLVMHGLAVGEGTATLRLLDPSGHEVRRGVAEVLAPDRVELDAYGSLIQGRDAEVAITEARMVENGQATYLVRYFHGDRELHGNGVLTVDAPPGVTALLDTGFLSEYREWLTLEASMLGSGMLELHVDQAAMASVPVVVVPESEIAKVMVLTQSEHGHGDGDWLVAQAQAYDGNGTRIFGAGYTWSVGAGLEEEGDLYRYRFKQGQFQTVHVQHDAYHASAMIQSDQGGVVAPPAPVYCSVGGGGSLVVGLVALGLVGVRRRLPR